MQAPLPQTSTLKGALTSESEALIWICASEVFKHQRLQVKKISKTFSYSSAKKIKEKPELLKLAAKLQNLKTLDEMQT